MFQVRLQNYLGRIKLMMMVVVVVFELGQRQPQVVSILDDGSPDGWELKCRMLGLYFAGDIRQ